MRSTKKTKPLKNFKNEQSVLNKHKIKPEVNKKFRNLYTTVSTGYKLRDHSLRKNDALKYWLAVEKGTIQ